MKNKSKIKIFDKSIMRLTALYTVFVMVITLIFSTALAIVSICEIRKPAQIPTIFQQVRLDPDFLEFYQKRASKLESTVWVGLILVNLSTFLITVFLSYWLAKSTLKPIEKAMDDEARFVSDASHELRTPLATMRMENEILLRDKEATKEDFKDQIKSNLEEIDKLRLMTDSLLKMCSSSEIDVDVYDVAPIVESAIDRVAKQAEAKNIMIDNQVKSSDMVCNPEALSEIIYIYLDNAIKYSDADSTVTIKNYNQHALAVVDSGPGVADKDKDNIFNRFYRADESRNSDGFGLGLSLAQRLAERIGGKLSVENNAPKPGATFIVSTKFRPMIDKTKVKGKEK